MSRNPSPAFDAVVEEIVALHDSKNADYGADDDRFKNFRGSLELNIPEWIGAEIRMGDKTRRIESFVKKGRLNNESVRDSLIDRACYAIIQVALYDQAAAREGNKELFELSPGGVIKLKEGEFPKRTKYDWDVVIESVDD